MKPFFVLLIGCLALHGSAAASDATAWQSSSYPAYAWKYLQEHGLKPQWANAPVADQMRALQTALYMGKRRETEVRELLSGTCRFWQEDFRFCSLELLSRASDSNINAVRVWIDERTAQRFWQLRAEAIRLQLQLRDGILLEEMFDWADKHLDPLGYVHLQSLKQHRDSAIYLEQARKALIPKDFDEGSSAARLRASFSDAISAANVLDGSRARTVPSAASGVTLGEKGKTEDGGFSTDEQKRRIWNEGRQPPLPRRFGGLGLNSPEERELSDQFKAEFRSRFERNPVGRELLRELNGQLPRFRIGTTQTPGAEAEYLASSDIIVLNREKAELIIHERGLEGAPLERSLLAGYLERHPEAVREVAAGMDVTVAHEASHAAQERKFHLSSLSSTPEFLENEQKAFVVQNEYELQEIRQGRVPNFCFGRTFSPREKAPCPSDMESRTLNFEAYYSDFDAYMRGFGETDYRSVPKLESAALKDGSAGQEDAKGLVIKDGEAFERLKRDYAQFFRQARKDWTRDRAEAIIAEAEELSRNGYSLEASVTLRELHGEVPEALRARYKELLLLMPKAAEPAP